MDIYIHIYIYIYIYVYIYTHTSQDPSISIDGDRTRGQKKKAHDRKGGSTNLNKKFERGEKTIRTERELIEKNDQQS